MFGLIRRISSSVNLRPDRPWEDDPTSNAPTRRKRRISTMGHEATGDGEQTRKKKHRGEDPEDLGSDDTHSSIVVGDTSSATNPGTPGESTDPTQREGSLEVKIVTKGVNEVELEDKQHSTDDTTATIITIPEKVPAHSNENVSDVSKAPPSDTTEDTPTVVNPASIPLPEDKADELDEVPSASHVSDTSALDREDSISTVVTLDSSEVAEPGALPKVADDSETPAADVPSRPETPRQTRISRSSAPSSAARKLRSKSPKKVSARA